MMFEYLGTRSDRNEWSKHSNIPLNTVLRPKSICHLQNAHIIMSKTATLVWYPCKICAYYASSQLARQCSRHYTKKLFQLLKFLLPTLCERYL